MEVGLRYLFKPDPAKLIDGNVSKYLKNVCMTLTLNFPRRIHSSDINYFLCRHGFKQLHNVSSRWGLDLVDVSCFPRLTISITTLLSNCLQNYSYNS